MPLQPDPCPAEATWSAVGSDERAIPTHCSLENLFFLRRFETEIRDVEFSEVSLFL